MTKAQQIELALKTAMLMRLVAELLSMTEKRYALIAITRIMNEVSKIQEWLQALKDE